MEKLFPNEIGDLELELKPYKYSGDVLNGDVLTKNIYDWEYTFETLEKLFYGFLVDNLNDEDFNKSKGIIDENLDKIKDFIKKNEYKNSIPYDRITKNSVLYIETINSKKILDKNYLFKYIDVLQDFALVRNFDEEFINFLGKFKKWTK